jgi:hypothetical protein
MEKDAAHAFDFLKGRWRARCRSPRPDGIDFERTD